ncbi:MAG: hypothetical protein VYD53_17855 [Pseudomonadota bacterium]|nr:hypothetical protein [Pseudomonadota bacterium]
MTWLVGIALDDGTNHAVFVLPYGTKKCAAIYRPGNRTNVCSGSVEALTTLHRHCLSSQLDKVAGITSMGSCQLAANGQDIR